MSFNRKYLIVLASLILFIGCGLPNIEKFSISTEAPVQPCMNEPFEVQFIIKNDSRKADKLLAIALPRTLTEEIQIISSDPPFSGTKIDDYPNYKEEFIETIDYKFDLEIPRKSEKIVTFKVQAPMGMKNIHEQVFAVLNEDIPFYRDGWLSVSLVECM